MSPEEAIKWRDPRVLLDGRGSDVLDDTEGEDQGTGSSLSFGRSPTPYTSCRETIENRNTTQDGLSPGSAIVQRAYGGCVGETTLRKSRFGTDGIGVGRGAGPRLGLRVRKPSSSGTNFPVGKSLYPPGLVLEKPWETEPGSWILDEDDPRSCSCGGLRP